MTPFRNNSPLLLKKHPSNNREVGHKGFGLRSDLFLQVENEESIEVRELPEDPLDNTIGDILKNPGFNRQTFVQEESREQMSFERIIEGDNDNDSFNSEQKPRLEHAGFPKLDPMMAS